MLDQNNSTLNRQLPQKSKENYRSGYYSGDSDFDSVSMVSMTTSEATTGGEQ